MARKIKPSRVSGNSTELKLQPHEELLLWRRRNNLTQGEAADWLGVPHFTYKRAEYGTSNNFEYGSVKLGKLQQHELCLVYRKRSNKTQEEIANKIGCSLYWFRKQETGKVSTAKLIAYWTKQ